jgi:hypothetical protein
MMTGQARDSRGLVPDDLAWTGERAQAPRYATEQAPTTLRPCVLCGEPAPPQGFGDPDYAVCGWPLYWGDNSAVAAACLERAQAIEDTQRAARSASLAAAAVAGARRAREEPPVAAGVPGPGAGPTLLGQSRLKPGGS